MYYFFFPLHSMHWNFFACVEKSDDLTLLTVQRRLGLTKLFSLSFLRSFSFSSSFYSHIIKSTIIPSLNSELSERSIRGYNILLHLMKHSMFKVVVSSFCEKKQTTFIIYLSTLETYSFPWFFSC